MEKDKDEDRLPALCLQNTNLSLCTPCADLVSLSTTQLLLIAIPAVTQCQSVRINLRGIPLHEFLLTLYIRICICICFCICFCMCLYLFFFANPAVVCYSSFPFTLLTVKVLSTVLFLGIVPNVTHISVCQCQRTKQENSITLSEI